MKTTLSLCWCILYNKEILAVISVRKRGDGFQCNLRGEDRLKDCGWKVPKQHNNLSLASVMARVFAIRSVSVPCFS